jgi:quercetin dioxygenase-like cupin family protein
VLKLLGAATGGSVMLFEESIPVETKSSFHLHRDSDEVAYVLRGEITFKIGDEVTVGGAGTCAFMSRRVQHAWKNSGTEAAQVLFLYTPAEQVGWWRSDSAHSTQHRAMSTRRPSCASATAGRSSARIRSNRRKGQSLLLSYRVRYARSWLAVNRQHSGTAWIRVGLKASAMMARPRSRQSSSP